MQTVLVVGGCSLAGRLMLKKILVLFLVKVNGLLLVDRLVGELQLGNPELHSAESDQIVELQLVSPLAPSISIFEGSNNKKAF